MLDNVKETGKLLVPTFTGGAMKKLPVDQMVGAFMNLREAIQKREDEIKELKEKQEKINEKLLALCEKENVDSLKTPMGTVSRRVSSTFWTSDWEKMHNFVLKHKAPHLLERRLHNKNVKEFLEDNPKLSPPGLQTNRKYVVSIRKRAKKPTKK